MLWFPVVELFGKFAYRRIATIFDLRYDVLNNFTDFDVSNFCPIWIESALEPTRHVFPPLRFKKQMQWYGSAALRSYGSQAATYDETIMHTFAIC